MPDANNTVAEQVRTAVAELQETFVKELRSAIAETAKQTREQVTAELKGESPTSHYDRIREEREAKANEGKNRVSGAERLMGGAR
jgi:hypothetical protein